MASKRMDLNRRTFLVLSGGSNPLAHSLALQLCSRFSPGSATLILDENKEKLETLKQQLQAQLKPHIVEVKTGILDAQHANGVQLMDQALKLYPNTKFERSILVHNEGNTATHMLLEPQVPKDWSNYVQHHLYAPVALNQFWLNCSQLQDVEKLTINVTSSLQVRPLVYSGLLCSCKRARDMYFRAMASEEGRSGVSVLNYAPGLLQSHQTQSDLNGNVITPKDVLPGFERSPCVEPLEAILKLINILEQISFVSGHDVDYYDTFVL